MLGFLFPKNEMEGADIRDMVFRVEKTKNYTVMSNYHLREKEMSLKAKGLLSWMLSNVDEWDYSIAGIVANCKENETAITSALNELQQFGYLSITKEHSSVNGRFEYVYNVYEKPINTEVSPEGDFPPMENPGVENPAMENPAVENPVLRNTIITNTNKRNTNIRTNTKVLGLSKLSPDLPETEEEPCNPLTEFQSHMYSAEDLKAERKLASSGSASSQPQKKSLYVQCLEEMDKRTSFTAEEKEALKVYLPVRMGIKDKPLLGVNMWKGLLNSLAKMQGDRVAIIEYSTTRGYASFYENCGKGDYTKGGGAADKSRLDKFSETPTMSCAKVRELSKEEQENYFSGKTF